MAIYSCAADDDKEYLPTYIYRIVGTYGTPI